MDSSGPVGNRLGQADYLLLGEIAGLVAVGVVLAHGPDEQLHFHIHLMDHVPHVEGVEREGAEGICAGGGFCRHDCGRGSGSGGVGQEVDSFLWFLC